MRILMAGGGTGGHLFPGLALAAALREKCAAIEIEFIGTAAGLETSIIPAAGYPLHQLAAGRGSPLSFSRPLNLPRFFFAMMQSLRLVKRTDTALVALGGYAAAAPGLAARIKRVPLIILEQNSIPGRVNRLLARGAMQVHNQFAEAVPHFNCAANICFYSGSPLRLGIAKLAQAAPCSGNALLIVGGSQGATRLNDLVIEAISCLAPEERMPILHIAGAGNDNAVREQYAKLNLAATVFGFAATMPELYRQSRLVISRAGAGSLAELAAAGLPACLVPLPSARDNHQQHNAEIIAKEGGAVVLAQETLRAEKLAQTIRTLWQDEPRRAAMATAIRKTAKANAATEIAEKILTL